MVHVATRASSLGGRYHLAWRAVPRGIEVKYWRMTMAINRSLTNSRRYLSIQWRTDDIDQRARRQVGFSDREPFQSESASGITIASECR